MYIEIKEIQNDAEEIERVKKFLYEQIRIVYDIGPTPKFHYDIEGLDEYYVLPKRSCFFAAYDGDKIVATAGIRAYDMDFEFFRGEYTEDNTASIWRLMVDENYRRKGIARILVKHTEEFAKKVGYKQIYLHTHRYLESGLPFWKSQGFVITVEEDDYDETSHMIKII